jgi:hypothetical protein
MEYLLQLKDGYLLNIESDEESYRGCPTCDYNSEYINTLTLICSKCIHTISVSQMYDFALPSGVVMKVFLRNSETLKASTEKDLGKLVKKLFVKETGETNFKLETLWK